MLPFIHVIACFLCVEIISTKCEESLTINTPSDHPIYYKSYYFQYNNPNQWSTNLPIHNTYPYPFPNQAIVSCTIDIPSLCIYTVSSNPGFYIFHKDIMFDFLNDANWTQIITLTPKHNINTPSKRRRLRKKRRKRRRKRRRRRRRRCSGRRSRSGRRCRCGRRRRCCCPRSITFLGRPQLLGPPQWIFGGPMTKFAPIGYHLSGAFPMGLGNSPLYPGLMGGYPGVSSPFMWPGTYHGVTGHPPMPGMNVLGVLPDNSGSGLSDVLGSLGQGGLSDVLGSLGQGGLSALGSLGRRIGRRRAKRRLIEDHSDGYSDVVLRKCVNIGYDEICGVYRYNDASLEVEVNVLMDGVIDVGVGDDVEYIEGKIWVWNKDSMKCNDELLGSDGYRICVKLLEGDDRVNVMITKEEIVYGMDLMSDEGWDKVFVNDNGNKKLCGTVEHNEICFRIMDNFKRIEIYSYSIWEE